MCVWCQEEVARGLRWCSSLRNTGLQGPPYRRVRHERSRPSAQTRRVLLSLLGRRCTAGKRCADSEVSPGIAVRNQQTRRPRYVATATIMRRRLPGWRVKSTDAGPRHRRFPVGRHPFGAEQTCFIRRRTLTFASLGRGWRGQARRYRQTLRLTFAVTSCIIYRLRSTWGVTSRVWLSFLL